jgi:membrane-bound inhibitor of C-type lysozyme
MKYILTAAAMVLAAAFSTTQTGGPRADWRCDGGAAFSVRFGDNSAEVFAGGQVYTLPIAVSASGARYSNGAVEYWGHQGEATLNGAQGGPYTHCRRR